MKQMSIAVIALIYGVDAIQIKGAPQPPVAPAWKPRDHKANIHVKKEGDTAPVSE